MAGPLAPGMSRTKSRSHEGAGVLLLRKPSPALLPALRARHSGAQDKGSGGETPPRKTIQACTENKDFKEFKELKDFKED